MIPLGFLSAGVALEVVLRIFDPYGISYYSEIDRYFRWLDYGGEILYQQPRNACSVFQGVPVCTDDEGLRVPAADDRNRNDASVILVLGDSVAFGWGVPAEAAFPLALQDRLDERGARFRLANAAVPSFNTEQEFHQMRRVWAGLNPKAVVLMYIMNDVESKRAEQKRRAALSRRLWHGLRSYTRSAASVEYLVRRVKNPTSVNRFLPDHPLWEQSKENLREITSFCRERQVPFGILFFSHSEDMELRDAALRLREAAGEWEVLFVDAAEIFRASGPLSALTNSRSDSHPNARGHEILASAGLELLRLMGMVR